ncbi:DMT family transporter [Ideonella sp. BN130291]|uniref:DMT family transporter n=1 Tax=Ideonella sp. BN130291 TaxID=3112940 RepID=UPI002E2527F9|nr:DMT family transporter [Ideonella sp. BN130291]
MRSRDLTEMLVLAAVWGAAFLLLRLTVPEFGTVPLAWLRLAGAAALLLPLLLWQGQARLLSRHWRPMLLMGVTNSALPFLCSSYAALHLTAGLNAILNAATPLFAAAIAWAWLHDRLSASRVLGLALGFAGVAWLAAARSGLAGVQGDAALWAMAACMVATCSYGFSACYAKKRLGDVPPVVSATGSLAAGALLLALPAAAAWPAQALSVAAWGWVLVLALLCTGVTCLMYFRLIARLGPARAVTVTFLLPVFGAGWGAVFLGERISAPMLAGGVAILLGTALATGALQRLLPRLRPASGSPAP